MGGDSAHFRLEEVASGAWAALARSTGASGSNSGIIDLGDRTLVFDTFLTIDAGHDLRRAAAHLTGREPTVVVNSHHHADHVGGNRAFAPESLISTARTRELMAAAEPDPPGDRATLLPARALEKDLVVEGSMREAHLLHYGGGHTDSDTFVFVPDAALLFAGDLLWVESHPWVGDGHPDEWVNIIYRMKALSPRTVVPGHGTVTSFEYARVFTRYLTFVCDVVRQAEAGSMPAVKLSETPVPPQYADWGSTERYRRSLEALGVRAGLPPY